MALVSVQETRWRAEGPYLPALASKAALLEETRLFLTTYGQNKDLEATTKALLNNVLLIPDNVVRHFIKLLRAEDIHYTRLLRELSRFKEVHGTEYVAVRSFFNNMLYVENPPEDVRNFVQSWRVLDKERSITDSIRWGELMYAKLGRGGKAGTRAEISAATQLFTEPYMVQWLLQNSLGYSYHEAYPQSALPETWSYYVKPEKLDTSTPFTRASLTLLDPCVGSGHFLRAAFDMFVDMYREQFPFWTAQEVANRILTYHLHGIDLDPRAAQLTALTLYLRAWELMRDERQQQYLPGPGSYTPPAMNLATTPTNLNKGALERHLQRHPQDSLFKPLIEEIFAGLEQAEILGSLLRPREYLDIAIAALQQQQAVQKSLFDPEMDDLRVKIAELAKNDPDELKKTSSTTDHGELQG